MGKYKSIFLESAVGTAGGLTAISGALLLGLAFGIPGFSLVTRENKKPKAQRNTGLLVLGFVLMILGGGFGLGLDAGGLFESVADQFSD